MAIRIPELHTLSSALRAYWWARLVTRVAALAGILGVVWIYLASQHYSNNEWPVMIAAGGILVFLLAGDRQLQLKLFIVNEWLDGDKQRFEEVASDLTRYLREHPVETDVERSDRIIRSMMLRVGYAGLYILGLAAVVLIAGLIEWAVKSWK